jgi:hypothetical protein
MLLSFKFACHTLDSHFNFQGLRRLRNPRGYTHSGFRQIRDPGFTGSLPEPIRNLSRRYPVYHIWRATAPLEGRFMARRLRNIGCHWKFTLRRRCFE